LTALIPTPTCTGSRGRGKHRRVLGDRSLRRLVGPAPPFSDDPPQLEFEALRGLDATDRSRATLDAEILGLKRAAGDHAPAVTPPLTPQAAQYASGLAHLALGDRASAAGEFSAAMSIAPDPRFALRLGESLADPTQAEAAWRQALALDPASGSAALRLARAALDRGDRLEAARLAPIAATAEDPFETGMLAADLALAESRPAEAVAALEGVARRVESAPDPLGLLQRLVVPYESAAALEPGGERAIASLGALAAAAPRIIEWRTLRADTLARIGRCSDAVIAIEALAAADVRPIELLLARTHCLESLGRRDDARMALAEVRRREPWRPEIGDLEDRLRAR
jgi:tetratricopeptide (TPR) repeat protein